MNLYVQSGHIQMNGVTSEKIYLISVAYLYNFVTVLLIIIFRLDLNKLLLIVQIGIVTQMMIVMEEESNAVKEQTGTILMVPGNVLIIKNFHGV